MFAPSCYFSYIAPCGPFLLSPVIKATFSLSAYWYFYWAIVILILFSTPYPYTRSPLPFPPSHSSSSPSFCRCLLKLRFGASPFSFYPFSLISSYPYLCVDLAFSFASVFHMTVSSHPHSHSHCLTPMHSTSSLPSVVYQSSPSHHEVLRLLTNERFLDLSSLLLTFLFLYCCEDGNSSCTCCVLCIIEMKDVVRCTLYTKC